MIGDIRDFETPIRELEMLAHALLSLHEKTMVDQEDVHWTAMTMLIHQMEDRSAELREAFYKVTDGGVKPLAAE